MTRAAETTTERLIRIQHERAARTVRGIAAANRRRTRQPMWEIRGTEIIRVRDWPGLPPAPSVEGRITRTPTPEKEPSDG